VLVDNVTLEIAVVSHSFLKINNYVKLVRKILNGNFTVLSREKKRKKCINCSAIFEIELLRCTAGTDVVSSIYKVAFITHRLT